ncbi:MAG: hypothetical protein PVG22_11415 [Chromatiales bacterium]|jgi:hypothetical protein
MKELSPVMQAIDIIQAVGGDINPARTKIHLASWDGEKDPLDIYLAEECEEWQKWQTKQNFERDYVLSFI